MLKIIKLNLGFQTTHFCKYEDKLQSISLNLIPPHKNLPVRISTDKKESSSVATSLKVKS